MTRNKGHTYYQGGSVDSKVRKAKTDDKPALSRQEGQGQQEKEIRNGRQGQEGQGKKQETKDSKTAKKGKKEAGEATGEELRDRKHGELVGSTSSCPSIRLWFFTTVRLLSFWNRSRRKPFFLTTEGYRDVWLYYFQFLISTPC